MVACKQNGEALQHVPDEHLPGIESDEDDFGEGDSQNRNGVHPQPIRFVGKTCDWRN
eukprot:COSAG02_NODE_973_length_15536_cov_5.108635_6_plen_57_part_00